MKIMLFFLLLLPSSKAFSCDVCGGAVGNVSGDAIPGIFNNYLGFNTSFRGFSSTHLTLFSNEEVIRSKELYSYASLHGRYSPVRRFQLLFNLPYSVVRKEMNGEVGDLAGLSDASIRSNFVVVDRSNDSLNKYLNLFLGATVKAPTGRSVLRESETPFFHRNMMLGSGTLDFGLHADLFFRKKNNGLIFNSSMLFRGKVKNEYDFGDYFQCLLSGFHLFEFSKASLMIDVGMSFTTIAQDRNLIVNEIDQYTGGWSLSPAIRLNYFWKELIVTAQVQRPVFQDLALGQVRNNLAVQAGVIYQFKKKKK